MSLFKPRGVEWVFSLMLGTCVTFAIALALISNFPRRPHDREAEAGPEGSERLAGEAWL
jgi:hypothetical protein